MAKGWSTGHFPQASEWIHRVPDDGDVQPNPGPYTPHPWLYPEQSFYADVIRHYIEAAHPIVTLGSIILCILCSVPQGPAAAAILFGHIKDFRTSIQKLSELAADVATIAPT